MLRLLLSDENEFMASGTGELISVLVVLHVLVAPYVLCDFALPAHLPVLRFYVCIDSLLLEEPEVVHTIIAAVCCEVPVCPGQAVFHLLVEPKIVFKQTKG